MPEPPRREVQTSDAPAPAFSYSQGIVAAGLLFIAGQVPRHPTTNAVPVTFREQARQALDNLSAVARASGSSLENTVRVNVYLADIETTRELDDIYREYFTDPFPARTTISAGLRGYLIEIDAVVAL